MKDGISTSDDQAVLGPRAVLLTGTVGAGKTTVAHAVGHLLAERRVPHAVIDVDALRQAWPAPAADRFNLRLALRNLADVSRNSVRAGAVRLVLAGVLETGQERAEHEAALGFPLAVCRLRVDLAVVRDRLLRRHRADPVGLEWHLHRAPELDAVLHAAAVEDHCLDVTAASPDEAALEVTRRIGW